MVRVYYPSVMLARDAARRIIGPEELVSVAIYQCVEVPSSMAVSPAYAVGWDTDRNLYLAVAEYGSDQQGPCYGGIILPKVNDTIEYLALVVDVKEPGWEDWRREVWELQWSNNLGAYKVKQRYVAPAVLRFTDSEGNVVASIPLGLAPLAIIAIALVGTAVGAAAYKFFSWKEADAKKEIVEGFARLCESDPAACHAAIAGVAAGNAEADTEGWLGKIKEYVVGGILAISGIILMALKWQILLELFRSMFRRR